MIALETTVEDELATLENGMLDPASFPHSEHVRLGYEMLQRYDFGETVMRFSRGLKLLAARVGKPEKYHATITVAFLSVIAERCADDPEIDWPSFKETNRDLLDKNCLERWYGPEQLRSDLARRVFCLPLDCGGKRSATPLSEYPS